MNIIEFIDAVTDISLAATGVLAIIEARAVIKHIKGPPAQSSWNFLHNTLCNKPTSSSANAGPSTAKFSEDQQPYGKEAFPSARREPQSLCHSSQRVRVRRRCSCYCASLEKRTAPPCRKHASEHPVSQDCRGHKRQQRKPKGTPHTPAPCAQIQPVCRRCACSSPRPQGKHRQ